MNDGQPGQSDETCHSETVDRSTFLDQLHRRFELPRDAIHDLVESATGHRIAELQRVVRGDENEVYRVRLSDGGTVFVRACFPDAPPRRAGAEADIMRRARIAGVPTPTVLSVRTLATGQGERQTMVLEAAAGVQLRRLLPTLSRARRATVMEQLGHLLGMLGTVPLPGTGRPDENGRWPDPRPDRRRYLAAVRNDSLLLDHAGLTGGEIAHIGELLDAIAEIPSTDEYILCHGDISAEHLFIDSGQRVSGLIDWGMWHGGTSADELATLFTRLGREEFATVLSRHPTAPPAEGGLGRDVACSLLTQSIGGLAWLIRSGQSDGRRRLTASIRQAADTLGRAL